MTARNIGHLLIGAGVGVWLVFAAIWLTGGSPNAAHFVPFHLAGVVPGSILSRWSRS